MLCVERFIMGNMASNCYIIYNDSQAVIIDPGSSDGAICDFINRHNLQIKGIILTHGHFDHFGGVEFIKNHFNCDVYIHKNDVKLLTDCSLNLSASFGGDICYDGVVAIGDCKMSLIDNDFEFISTPGHSPGSMCVKVGNYLFTGDTLFKGSIGRAFSPYGDTDLEIASIKQKLFTLQDDVVCYPGHGSQSTISYEKRFNPYLK